MKYIVAHIFPGDKITWDDVGGSHSNTQTGIIINFPLSDCKTTREAIEKVNKLINCSCIDWLRFKKYQSEFIFLSKIFKQRFPAYKDESWLARNVLVELEQHNDAIFRFAITSETVANQSFKIKIIKFFTDTLLNSLPNKIIHWIVGIIVSIFITPLIRDLLKSWGYDGQWLLSILANTPLYEWRKIIIYFPAIIIAVIVILSVWIFWSRKKVLLN
jgi:hypothetical protein